MSFNKAQALMMQMWNMNLSQVLKVNKMMLHWSRGQAELEISTGNKPNPRYFWPHLKKYITNMPHNYTTT
jgi:hypothetical protein